MSLFKQACVLVINAVQQGMEAHMAGDTVVLRIKPCQAKAAKELLKDHTQPCRVYVERARKPTRRYYDHFDFIRNYPNG